MFPERHPEYQRLRDALEAAYRALVSGYIACEQNYFGQTEPVAAVPSSEEAKP